MKWIVFTLLFLSLSSCVTKDRSVEADKSAIGSSHSVSGKPGKGTKATKTSTSEKQTSVKVSGVKNQDDLDMDAINKMNSAMDEYVFKRQKTAFRKLCRDPRFDCFVDDRKFPSEKRAEVRSGEPLAKGSKMGMEGEKRVQVRYEFYP